MSEQTPSKQPASNPYTVADYATGFMMGLEDRGWTKLDRDLEYDIRGEVESLWDKLDVDGMEERIAELERERDAARERCAIAEDLLRRVVIHGGSGSWSWREMGDWCCDYAGFMRGLGELNHKRSHAHCLHRETPGTADGAIGAGASEAPVHHLYGSRGLWARAEKAEARVAELEAILHDAPTIAEVETHAPGWLGCVRAALGKEAQP